MPPDDLTTPPAEQTPVATPAAPAVPADVAALVATLNPRAMGQPVAEPKAPVEPQTPAAEPKAPVAPVVPTPQDRGAPLNFVEIRKAREAAVAQVETL